MLWFGSRDMKGWLASSFPSRFITQQQEFHRGSHQQDRFFRRTGSSKGSSSQHKQILTAGQPQALPASQCPCTACSPSAIHTSRSSARSKLKGSHGAGRVWECRPSLAS